jgi:hypothetical protein
MILLTGEEDLTYSFRLHGELIHRVGSLLPPDGQAPVYAQLYFHDSADDPQAADTAHAHTNAWNSNLDPVTLHLLQDMCVHTWGNFMLGCQGVTSRNNIKVIWDEEDRERKTKNIVYSEVFLTE